MFIKYFGFSINFLKNLCNHDYYYIKLNIIIPTVIVRYIMKEMYQYYQISQKSRYALRALLQLALLGSRQPIGVRKLADAQDIPTRFLEVILSELRHGGFVLSVRGKHGGYFLARKPSDISAGQVIRFIESIRRGETIKPSTRTKNQITAGDFSEKWLFERVNTAVAEILDEVTLEDMVNQEQQYTSAYVGNYVI